MTLPGKLTIGFLQEDNPQKFYFRVRPLFVEEEQEYTLVDDAALLYLDDGYIRIVPDKNEISHFKMRMRSLGQYCLIDLRKHTNENDKIRPNKNYQRDSGDHNAYIVYSDVIFRMPDNFMAEIAEGDAFPKPGTRYVCRRKDGALEGPFEWTEAEDGLAHATNLVLPADAPVALSELPVVVFDAPEGPRGCVMRIDRLGIPDIPAEPRPEPRLKLKKTEQKPESEPVETQDAPAPEPPAEAASVEAVPAEPVAAVMPLAPALPLTPAEPALSTNEEPARETPPVRIAEPIKPERDDGPKPWIQKTTFPVMRAVSARLNLREQSLVMQSGINPRRGASIRDVVDDQWRQSRLDQLGSPAALCKNAEPIASPVERATKAFAEAWQKPEARPGLVRELLRNRELAAALELVKAAPELELSRAATDPVTSLEADRLRLLDELTALKKEKTALRDAAMNELRASHVAEIERLEKRRDALAQAVADASEKAASAKRAERAACDSLARVTRESMDEKLCDAITQARAADLLRANAFAGCAGASVIETQRQSGGEMISDLRVRFEAAGMALANDDAARLLTCLALGRVLILSGPTGCGKSACARLLARSLGLAEGRFAEMRVRANMENLADEVMTFGASGVPVVRRPEIKRLLDARDGDAPSILLLDEANRACVDRYAGELLALAEPDAPRALAGMPIPGALRVLMTALDAPEGMPLSPETLDRAYFIRLAPLSETAPWAPPADDLPPADKAISLDSLLAAFRPQGELPDETTRRMASLRESLAKLDIHLSRRALNDTYRMLLAAQPYAQSAPIDQLDWALSVRAIPYILASADLNALHELPALLTDLPRSLALMDEPIALPGV